MVVFEMSTRHAAELKDQRNNKIGMDQSATQGYVEMLLVSVRGAVVYHHLYTKRSII
jgi:hypothetical protein